MKQVNQVKLGEEFIKKTKHRETHDNCLWNARMRRDKSIADIPEWEEMRDLASQIKEHTLGHLAKYLEQLEGALTKMGVTVHWAEDARQHNKIIESLLKAHDVRVVTKAKSMTMDECELRQYLEGEGIEIYEGDLGERIQQLDNQRDSHIVMPAIHKLREDVSRLFADKLGSDPEKSDPHYLNEVMRKNTRPYYFKSDAGLSGVNFAVAETGTLVVCTNEGDADICSNLPPLLIFSMGIEKVIPRAADLPLFIRLLSRSALGFSMTQYTTHYNGPRPGQEMHVVILDNGRSKRLADKNIRSVLKCIRCSACMNTCPVFRRTSGISYDATYPGPIGIVLEPSYDLQRYARLPYSCTHCGSCGAVCPVKVPIPDLVFYWRNVIVEKKLSQKIHDIEEYGAMLVLKSASNLAKAEKLGLWALRNLPEGLLEVKLNLWARYHKNPIPPEETFRQYYNKNIKPKKK